MTDAGLPPLPPGVRVRAGARLSAWTTFRLGGPCRALVACPSADLLVEAYRRIRGEGLPWLLIGGGSNVLVSERGTEAVVLRFAGAPVQPVRVGHGIEVDGGMSLDRLSEWCAVHGLDGLGFAAGIPGTVAGAVAGNAGAFGRQVADLLDWAEALEDDGRVLRLTSAEMGFSYRRCRAAEEGRVLLRFGFQLPAEDPEQLAAERASALAFRRERHPDWRRLPCAGSFFRNIEPTSAAGRRQASGWFLEQAGVRGMEEGGARVYERHCNIIVADGAHATSTDVYRLAARMAAAVRDRFGLELEREVRLVGSFPGGGEETRGRVQGGL